MRGIWLTDQQCEDKDVREKADVCNNMQEESAKKLWDFKRRNYGGERTDAPDYFLIKSAARPNQWECWGRPRKH